MPPGSTAGELSLRHLPDVSDSSFSFQIPGVAQEYALLAEDDLDFFSGANVSDGAAPLSSAASSSIAPLTLHELTPRPAFEARALKGSKRMPTAEAEHSEMNNQKDETRATRLQQPERSKVRTKFVSNLRPITTSLVHPPAADAPASAALVSPPPQDIDTRAADLHVPMSSTDQESAEMDKQRPKGIRRTSLEKKLPPSRAERRRQLVPRNKQIVIEGGVTKSRSPAKSSEIRSPARISNSVERPSPIFPSYVKPTVSEDLNGDDSLTDMSMGPSGGVAERLLEYGQHLTNSFGMYTSSPFQPRTASAPVEESESLESHATLKITPSADADVPLTSDDSDKSLTVSQLSPRKCPPPEPSPTPPAKRSVSPLRTSSKRPASPDTENDSENTPRKKGKTADAPPPSARVNAGAPTTATTSTRPATRQQTQRKQQAQAQAPAASSSSSRSKPMSEEVAKRKPATRADTLTRASGSKASTLLKNTLRRSKASVQDETTRAVTKSRTETSATSLRSARVLRNARARDGPGARPPASSLLASTATATSTGSTLKEKGKASANGNITSQLSERAVLPPWDDGMKAAPPAPAQGQALTESRRLLARRGDAEGPSQSQSDSQSHLTSSASASSSTSQSQSHSQSQREKKYVVPIPNYHAMHAAQEAKLALLKENIHPTIPHPPHLVTDQRVRERQRFDEMVREREAEQARVEEEARRERQREEELELKEMRRKAIPRAHEVPEWYREAPRKKESRYDVGGR